MHEDSRKRHVVRGGCGNLMVTAGNHNGLKVELLSILGILGGRLELGYDTIPKK